MEKTPALKSVVRSIPWLGGIEFNVCTVFSPALPAVVLIYHLDWNRKVNLVHQQFLASSYTLGSEVR